MTVHMLRPRAVDDAEAFLREEMADNIEHGIRLYSANPIIERLLKAPALMTSVYVELFEGERDKWDCEELLRQLVYLAAYWNPDETKKVRDQVSRAERLNKDIAQRARELADLMRRRNDGCQDVSTPYDHSPVELIVQAAQRSNDLHKSGLFKSWVEDGLTLLRTRFDGKYWPTTDELLNALADVQSETAPQPHDSAMMNAISSRSHSAGDFIRAMLTRLDEITDPRGGNPHRSLIGFSFTDGAIASFASASLGLDPPLSADSVAKHRERFRDSQYKKDSWGN